jgi:hypothetical protein
MAGMVLIAITPLSAAQIMLLIDRYLGGHFFDTQAGGSAVLWMYWDDHDRAGYLVLPPEGPARDRFVNFQTLWPLSGLVALSPLSA